MSGARAPGYAAQVTEATHHKRDLEEGVQRDFRTAMSYGDYLHLDQVLSAQHPLSVPLRHDELLFIIQHQTSELWLKLMLHELRSARQLLRDDDLRPALKRLARVKNIQATLTEQWSVLATLTPSEYAEFRAFLASSSGFQSWQYRAVEFLAGNRNLAMLGPHDHRPEIIEKLEAILARPSLYDEAILLLARNGFDIGTDAGRDSWRETRPESDAVLAAWETIYRDPHRYWMFYELAEKLVDFEDYFRRWRFNHVTTVERIIGLKRGTGGTGGVSYLRKMLEVELFPELWKVRTVL